MPLECLNDAAPCALTCSACWTAWKTVTGMQSLLYRMSTLISHHAHCQSGFQETLFIRWLWSSAVDWGWSSQGFRVLVTAKREVTVRQDRLIREGCLWIATWHRSRTTKKSKPRLLARHMCETQPEADYYGSKSDSESTRWTTISSSYSPTFRFDSLASSPFLLFIFSITLFCSWRGYFSISYFSTSFYVDGRLGSHQLFCIKLLVLYVDLLYIILLCCGVLSQKAQPTVLSLSPPV